MEKYTFAAIIIALLNIITLTGQYYLLCAAHLCSAFAFIQNNKIVKN